MPRKIMPIISNGFWLLVIIGMGIIGWQITHLDDNTAPFLADVTSTPTRNQTQLATVSVKQDLDPNSFGTYTRQVDPSDPTEQVFVYGRVVLWDYEAGELIVDAGERRVQVTADPSGVYGDPDRSTPALTATQARTYLDEEVTMWVREQDGELVVSQIMVTSYE